MPLDSPPTSYLTAMPEGSLADCNCSTGMSQEANLPWEPLPFASFQENIFRGTTTDCLTSIPVCEKPFVMHMSTEWRNHPRWKPLMESPCPLVPDPSPPGSWNTMDKYSQLRQDEDSWAARRRAEYYRRPPVWNIRSCDSYQRDNSSSHDSSVETPTAWTTMEDLMALRRCDGNGSTLHDDPFVEKSVGYTGSYDYPTLDAIATEWARQPLVVAMQHHKSPSGECFSGHFLY